MSFDLAIQGKGVFYLNFMARGVRGENVKAEVDQRFNRGNLIERTGDYIVAVERLVVPIQTIPMCNEELGSIILNDGLGNVVNLNTFECYSLKEFIDGLNTQIFNSALDGAFKIDVSGEISFYFPYAGAGSVTFSPTMANRLSVNLVYNPVPIDSLIRGEYSIIDRFDQLHKIQVEANGLSIQQEIIDTNTSYEILTDYLVPNNYNISYSEPDGPGVPSNDEISISYPVRQNIFYNASSARRFAILTGFSPVQSVKVACFAMYKDGTRHDIILPSDSVFEMKLGLYKRS